MPRSAPDQDFLKKLEKEAKLQAQLHEQRLLPKSLAGVARFVAQHPWQVVLVVSGLTALVVG